MKSKSAGLICDKVSPIVRRLCPHSSNEDVRKKELENMLSQKNQQMAAPSLVRSMIRKLRNKTAAPLAKVAQIVLRSPVMPAAVKQKVWSLMERYVSFFGVSAVVTTSAGYLLDVKTSSMVEKQIFYFGEWEPYFSRYLIDHPCKDRVFLDLGANIGYFSTLAAKLYEHVIAIEASPSIFLRLKENVLRNGLHNVTLVNVAVGQQVGSASFFLNSDHNGASSLIEGHGSIIEAEVTVLPLFDILPEWAISRIGMIKVDVEGFEHIVLGQILERLADLPQDIKILVEYGPERAGNLSEIFVKLLAAGFTARQMQGLYSIDEYINLASRSDLSILTAPPAIFSDILFERR